MKNKRSIGERLSSLLSSDEMKTVLANLLLRVLKAQSMGGIKGWLIEKLVTEFTDEVLETIRVNVDHVEIKRKMNDTADMQNRDDATDRLNDLMR